VWLGALLLAGGSAAAENPLVEVPPDRSLTAEQYVARGLPTLELDWGAEETARALRLLEELAHEDPTLLPRFGSVRSGRVFDRILAESLTSGELAGDAPSTPLPSYAFDPATGVLFDRELVEIQRAVAEASLRVVEESVAAHQEVNGWLAEAGREGRPGSVEQLRGMAESQLRIRDAYGARVLGAVEGLAGMCETQAASLQARAEARTHAEQVLARATPLLAQETAAPTRALLERLEPGCGVPAPAAP
jgi:hypothetical protein